MSPISPRTNAAIIDAFGLKRFGEVCGFTRHPIQRANDMRRRDSIPQHHWDKILAAAPEVGLDLTIETLHRAQSALTGRESVAPPDTQDDAA